MRPRRSGYTGQKLNKTLTEGIEPAVLDAMTVGLRQMKDNVSRRRLGVEAQRPRGAGMLDTEENGF